MNPLGLTYKSENQHERPHLPTTAAGESNAVKRFVMPSAQNRERKLESTNASRQILSTKPSFNNTRIKHEEGVSNPLKPQISLFNKQKPRQQQSSSLFSSTTTGQAPAFRPFGNGKRIPTGLSTFMPKVGVSHPQQHPQPRHEHDDQDDAYETPSKNVLPLDGLSSPLASLSQSHIAHSTFAHHQGSATPACSTPKSRSRSRSEMRISAAYNVSRSGSGGGREQSAQFNTVQEGDAGDDMATIMMRGATQVRNVTAELGEQRRTNTFLNERISTLSADNAELSRRIEKIKTTAKAGLDESSKCYAILRTAFQELKASYDSSQAFVLEVRATLADFNNSRQSASATIEAVEPLLNEDAQYIKGLETKALITELEQECDRSHQVITLLRDKLHVVSGDLADAKNRIGELEANQIKEGSILAMSTQGLAGVGEKISTLMESLAKREQESIDALNEAHNAEAKLGVANEMMTSMRLEIEQKDAELADLRAIQGENIMLKTRLDEISARFSSLEVVHQRTLNQLSVSVDTSNKRATDLGILGSELASCIASQEQMKILLQKAETQASSAGATIRDLQEDLKLASVRESALTAKYDEIVSRMTAVEAEVGMEKKMRTEAQDLRQETNTRHMILQERFDDQTTSLRLEKERCAELQERVVSAESVYATKLAASAGKADVEIAVLQEQKATLEVTLQETREELIRQRNAFVGASVEFEKKFAQQDTQNNRFIEAEQLRSSYADREAKEAQLLVTQLREQISDMDGQLAEATMRANAEPVLSSEQMQEVDDLKTRVRELEIMNDGLERRAKNIKLRHKEGTLNAEEKEFAHSLIQMTKSIHEEDLIAKGNELRRRENAITVLQTRIGVLESTLARHLTAKGPETGPDAKPMIDPHAWMLSSPLSTQSGPAELKEPSQDIPVASTSTTTIIIPPYVPAPVPVIADPKSPRRPRSKAAPVQYTTKKKPTVAADKIQVPPVAVEGMFSKLAAVSEDSEDDIPLSDGVKLGKRVRESSPIEDDSPAPVARRKRTVSTRKTAEPPQKPEAPKRAEGTAKPKARKRRG